MLRFLRLWLSLFFTQRRQTATKKILRTFKLNVVVSYVGNAFQTWHVIISYKCMQLLTK